MTESLNIRVGGRIDLLPFEKSPDPPIEKEFHWVRSRPLWGDLHQEMMRITDGDSWIAIDHARRSASIHLSPRTATDLPFFARTFLLLPVVELLRAAGYIYIHGALVTKGEFGLLLLGSGGAGKSTTSAALWQAGWNLMADDSLLYHAETGQLFPFETELALAPSVMEQIGFSSKKRFDGKKIRIELDDQARTLKVFKGTLSIALLSNGEKDLFEPLPKSDAFRILERENPLLTTVPSLSNLHFHTLQKLVSSASAYRLTLRRKQPVDLNDLGQRVESLINAKGSLTRNPPKR